MTNVLPKAETPKSASQAASEVTAIMFALERHLRYKTNFLSNAIKYAVGRQMPGIVIINEIKDMIRDNEIVMEDILGNSLLTTIKNFSHV